MNIGDDVQSHGRSKRRWSRLHGATWLVVLCVGGGLAKCQCASDESRYWDLKFEIVETWESWGWPFLICHQRDSNLATQSWFIASILYDVLAVGAILVCVALCVERWVRTEGPLPRRPWTLLLMTADVGGMVAVVSMQRTVKYPLTNDFWGDLLVTRNSLPSGPLDASITVAAVALVALTGSRWWTSENPYQFRLRSLFILTAVVALVLASGTHTWVAGQLTNRRSAVENDAHKNLVRPAVPCSPYDVQPLPVRILVLFGVGCVIHQGAGALAHLPLVLVRRHTRRLRRPRSPCSSESPDESPAESE